MIAIIVISEDPFFRELIEEDLRDDDWKISFHATFVEAQPLLASEIFDFCVLDAGPSLSQAIEAVELLKPGTGDCKFIAVAEGAPADQVQHAYQQGMDCVLPKPLPPRLLRTVLSPPIHPNYPMPSNSPPAAPHGKNPSNSQNLDILRDFSRILSHSLDLPSLVHHFVLKVREIIGVNRVAIFLEDPKTGSPSAPKLPYHRLRCICSIGIPADVQNCLELSKKSGVGSWVTQSGQILRAEQAGALLAPGENSRAQHEFNLLGCQIAIPIVDRERTIGVAMLGGHLTRIGFSDEELQLMFHLMEELGLSVKNNWLHSELAANHRLFGDVLSSMKSGSLVVGPELEIVHANPAMVAFIKGKNSSSRPLSFADLPGPIAERVHEVVENGKSVEPFDFRGDGDSGKTFHVSVIPFQNPSRHLPQSAMVVMEDFTEVEQAREIAVEAANAKLTSLIAKRFAHEIRNSLVPLTTHLQLMDDRYQQPDFQKSLKQALETETSRISRFTEQMLFLAEPSPAPSVLTSVEKILRESFARAQASLHATGILTVQNYSNLSCIQCHPQALAQAFQEVFINGLQASPSPRITVTIDPSPRDQSGFLCIGFRDNGEGFTGETARMAVEPFYTSRNTGVGLGLTVANKVALDHGGWLEVQPRSTPNTPDVFMFFPIDHRNE